MRHFVNPALMIIVRLGTANPAMTGSQNDGEAQPLQNTNEGGTNAAPEREEL
jgi:hypothetical protein